MPPRQYTQSLSKEGRIDLALISLKSQPYKSLRSLAALYNVLRSTLQTRLQGTQAKHEITLPNLKMSPIEEQSLIKWILDLD
jgi:hypothetical protein